MSGEKPREPGRRDPLVVDLAGAATLDASRVGAKAANLARLASAGFSVPPGFVVMPVAQGRLREVSEQISRAAGGLGAERFAVRSSGVAEDLEGASFAGQYETLLDVPIGGLTDAVGRVFDSASAPRVSAYMGTRAGRTPRRTLRRAPGRARHRSLSCRCWFRPWWMPTPRA